jgi:hypothetical protein
VGLFDRADEGDGPRGRLRRSGGDTVQLVIDYVKQETLEPLKGLLRFLAFGVAGSLALCVGVVLLLVALLRLLQSETGGTFAGNLSWLPYLIVVVAATVVIGLLVWRAVSGPAARRLPPGTDEGKT